MNCLVNFLVTKHRMASLWRPGRGVVVKYLGSKLILFKFYHQHDLRWVMDGGPWNLDNHLLVLYELKPGEEPLKVPLYFSTFWVQVYDLPACFFSEVDGKALADYIRTFMAYDLKNVKSRDRPFMWIRVKVHIRQPLKKGKKMKKDGCDWITAYFRYEKLPSFCFIYG